MERCSAVLQRRQMPEFSGVCENYGLEGTKVRFLVSPADKNTWLIAGPAKARSLSELRFPARHVRWDACQAPCGDNIQVCLDFHVLSGVRISAGCLSCRSKHRNGVAKNQDTANNGAADDGGARLPPRAGRHRLLFMPGPGSQWMSSKQPRSSPALQPGMKRLSCSAGAESTI